MMNRWPAVRFAELAQRLHDQFGVQIVLFWGKSEEGLSREFCKQVRFQPIKVAPTALRELAAYFTNCDLLICNDTGVMHIGAAVGVPLVAIFGPTDPKEWKPVGKSFVAVRGEAGKIENVGFDQAFATLLSTFGDRLNAHHRVANMPSTRNLVSVDD